jgi:uncharacterized protein YndB with AHSA1/START domain
MSGVAIVAEPGKQQIAFTRVLDAPRELVFKAYTDSTLLAKWLGPRRLTMTVLENELKRGGVWRFIHRAPDGREYGFRGVYHEVSPPRRIVRTFEFEGMLGHVSLETATFDEHDGKTTVVGTSVFQSVEDRDGQLASGLEEGLSESMDRLAELLRSMPHGSAR